MKQDKTYIFRSYSLSKRLLFIKKELEKYMIIDESKKTIVINKSIEYSECLVLEKFYQDYIVDVDGNVWLNSSSLKQLPKILFNNVIGSFLCFDNNLISLEYSPKIVGDDFYCYDNPGRFTKDSVKKVCIVKDEII